MLVLAVWIRAVVAAVLFVVILGTGITFLRGLGAVVPKERIEAEDVAGLNVWDY